MFQIVCLLLFVPFLAFALNYRVDFIGLDQKQAIKAMFDASDLVTLQDRPPATLNALRYRAQGDIPDLLKVLKAFGFYDASIRTEVSLEGDLAVVTLYIDAGPQYTIGSYEIYQGTRCTELANIPHCTPFTPESLGVPIGSAALSVNIVNAEMSLLTELAKCGYPLASVEKRRVIVDMQEKKVEAAACIEEGPLSKFGPLSIIGLKKVQPSFIMRRVAWNEGEIYSSIDVEETQKRLLNSNLFSSVLISHEEKINDEGELPIKMRLSEAKHRQVSLGPFYATVDGPGGMFNWTHRNLRGLGETLSINGEVSKRYITGIVTYKKPDVFLMNQTYRLLGQIERLDIHAYNAVIYRAANFLDHKINPKSYLSIGLQFQSFNVTDSANNNLFLFLDIPMLIKYNNADDPLNPTHGYTIAYQPQFFQSVENGGQRFVKQRLTTTFYIPLIQKNLTFAGRMEFGSIAGAKQKNIPLPVLFLGGSEDDLRGYRYLTVSPLDAKNRPLGGRSAIFLSGEMRFRFGDFGIVPFGDFGTVAFNELPTIDTKWYKSVGIGLRYFTFFGPLRFDVGFPLDPRKGIDKSYRFYASIGQAY